MTRTEYAQLAAVVRALWPNAKQLDDAGHDVAFALLEPVGHEAAMQAVRRLAVDGREFPPPVGLIVREATADAVIPTVDDALGLYMRARSLERRTGDRSAAVEWLADQSPTVALFVTEIGWQQLGREQVDDPSHGSLVRSRLAASLGSCANQAARDPEHTRRVIAQRSSGGGRGGLRLVSGAIADLQAGHHDSQEENHA